MQSREEKKKRKTDSSFSQIPIQLANNTRASLRYCPITTGDAFLKTYGFSEHRYGDRDKRQRRETEDKRQRQKTEQKARQSLKKTTTLWFVILTSQTGNGYLLVRCLASIWSLWFSSSCASGSFDTFADERNKQHGTNDKINNRRHRRHKQINKSLPSPPSKTKKTKRNTKEFENCNLWYLERRETHNNRRKRRSLFLVSSLCSCLSLFWRLPYPHTRFLCNC